MYKVFYSQEVYKVCWEEYQVVKRVREYLGCGKEYNEGKKGKQYNLPYNIKAVGKNINWEEGKGISNQAFIWNFFHPCLIIC